jgi:hypothetical protein|tara:strand:- start:1118 stop:1711 length:594 start_codon:yes stop_codon:yes gene_type:complete
MVLDSLLAGVMLFSSFAARTPNVQPNPDDYEVSFGVSNDNFYANRQWERELGTFYIDDLFWYKYDKGIYFKPEFMNKESQSVKYLKVDARRSIKDWSFGITSRSIDDDIIGGGFETFVSFGMSKKKKYYSDKIEVEATFDGYFPPSQEDGRDTFEFEDKFKVSYKVTEKLRLYNVGEISKLQGKEFYKAKIGFEYSL